MTSAAAAASQGARDANPRGLEIETAASRCASSITVHISSSGGGGGSLKLRGSSRITSLRRLSSIMLLLECGELLPELRSCRGQPALARPFRDAEDAGDLRVRVSLYVVHYQRHSISVRKVVYCPRDAFLQIRLRFRSGDFDSVCLIELYFTCHPQLATPRVRNHGYHYPVQPGRERRITPELRESGERADESILRELPGFLRVPTQSIGERVDAWRVRIVQRTPGQPIPRDDSGDELCLVHAVVYLPLISVATIFCKVRHGERHKRSVGFSKCS